MNILAVEELWWDRQHLKQHLKKALPDANIRGFDNTAEALEFAKENPIGAAFIDMGKSNQSPGLFLAQDILKLQKTNIIFTSYEWQHLEYAMQMRASGYIRKPMQYKEILEELQNLRYPLVEAGQPVNQFPCTSKKRHWLLDKIANLA